MTGYDVESIRGRDFFASKDVKNLALIRLGSEERDGE